MTYVEILDRRRRAGRPIATIDRMIASVARSQGSTMVTRDIGGFTGCGVALIDPWTATDA